MDNINSFLKNVTVIDTETTHLQPELAEVVEIAAATWNNGQWTATGMLMGADNGIPPAASAKNNISNKMIAGKPTFADRNDDIADMLSMSANRWYVAHNANYDRSVLTYAWARANSEEGVALAQDQSRWICTWRLSRHVLSHDFDDIEYGLNYLRYLLDIPVPDDIQLHRATDDTKLCALLLEYLVSAAARNGMIDTSTDDLGEQLNQLCWSAIPLSTWPFGKYKGHQLSSIPNDYYSWAFKNVDALKEGSSGYDSDLAESVRHVLEARLLAS